MQLKWFKAGGCVPRKYLQRDNICLSLKCLFAMILSIKIEIQAGKESVVDFSTGQDPMVYKAKNGHLMVVREVLL